MAGLKRVNTLQQVQRGFLDQIAGIESVARVRGQLAVRPAPQLRQAPLQQSFDGRPVAVACFEHELNRWLIAQQRTSAGRLRLDVSHDEWWTS